MLSKRSRRVVFLAMLFSVALSLHAQSDLVRKVIHEDGYIPTPGDVYTLTINFGINISANRSEQTESIPLVLSSDYTINVPYIGSVDVRGLSYPELQEVITTRFSQRALAQHVALNLTAPAVYDIFVWGAVQAPGLHTVSSLNRLTDLLVLAGGPLATGSRRQISVYTGSRVREYDLLAYTSQGDEDQNPFIRPGDRVFVPVAEAAVQVQGAVVLPSTYEILEDETLGDVIALAGGLLPTAEIDRTTVRRIGNDGRYSIMDMRETNPTDLALVAGDIIAIPSTTTTTETIQIEGALYTGPAEEGIPRAIPVEPVLLEIPYTTGVTVLQVLEQMGGPTHFADTASTFIVRADGERLVVPDLSEIWESRQWDRDIELYPGDRLVIPMLPLTVAVGGSVNAPGAFPFTSGYFVRDYLRLAGWIDIERGSLDDISIVDLEGNATPVTLDSAVPAGSTIYVGQNRWTTTREFFDNFFIATGWVTGIITVATAIIGFVDLVTPP